MLSALPEPASTLISAHQRTLIFFRFHLFRFHLFSVSLFSFSPFLSSRNLDCAVQRWPNIRDPHLSKICVMGVACTSTPQASRRLPMIERIACHRHVKVPNMRRSPSRPPHSGKTKRTPALHQSLAF